MVWVPSGKRTGMKDWRGTYPDKVKLQHWSALASYSEVFLTQWLGWSATQKLWLEADPEVGRSRGSRTVCPSTVVIGWTRGWTSGQASFQRNENHRLLVTVFSSPSPSHPTPSHCCTNTALCSHSEDWTGEPIQMILFLKMFLCPVLQAFAPAHKRSRSKQQLLWQPLLSRNHSTGRVVNCSAFAFEK